ncbi:MAG: Na/Pi cotransporter family protein [Lachnospiraceae bacterium]|nr:Na/Pi cotransporter family protein [Lachnospiraceae bacterium]
MIAIIIELLGGLGLFIFGMNLMSSGIERAAGSGLRSIVEKLAKNKFMGLITGLIFTAVIQSSSAATVMVVSFVNSGLMTLAEASGIILGANIGTTVTALLVALKLSAIAPLFVFAGAVMYNFIKEPMTEKMGQILLGFGVLFVGISTMSSAMGTLKDTPVVIETLSHFTNPVLGILMGLVITSVVQSSSVTVSILVVMASQGLIDLRISMFVILGCNIGACTSAVLASLSGNKNSKRSALIHLLFNIFGTILMFVLLLLFGDFIEHIITTLSGGGTDPGSLGRNIAFAHLTFKVFQVIVFYPFMDLIIKLTYVLVRGEESDEKVAGTFRLKYIGDHAIPNPTVAIYLAVEEMERMARKAFGSLNLAVTCLMDNNTEDVNMVHETEEYIDYLDENISDYLVKINRDNLPLPDANRIAAYFHVVNDIERIGDHADNIAKIVTELSEEELSLSDESKSELKGMMKLVNTILEKSLYMFVTGDTAEMKMVADIEDEIDVMERDLQSKHIKRLNEGKCSAQVGIYFSDIVSALERVSDHAINIAFALVESKK